MVNAIHSQFGPLRDPRDLLTEAVILKFDRRSVRVDRPPVFRGWFSGPRLVAQLPFVGTVK